MIILLFIWEISVIKWDIEPWRLPSPTGIFQTLFNTFPMMLPHIRGTMTASITGLLLAVTLSFIIALLLDTIPFLKKAVYPLVITSQTIPLITVAPLLIMWLGFGMKKNIFIVVLVCFFPMLINILDGLTSVDGDLLNLLRSMGASKLKIFSMVKLPSALPSFFSGLRISASYSIMGAVIAEWLGTKEGLGQYMILSQRSWMIDRVFSAIIVITGLSLILVQLVTTLERFLLPWKTLKTEEWQ